MPFGLTNATFMRLMTQMIQPKLGGCVIAYFDDIFVYTKNQEDQLKTLQQVFELLRIHKFLLISRFCSK